MLDKILDKVKEFTLESVSNSTDIADDKKELATKITIDTLVNDFKEFFSDGNFIENVKDLFDGDTFEKLNINIVDALTKAGIDKISASNFTASLIPNLKAEIVEKLNFFEDFNFNEIIGKFTGKNNNEKAPNNSQDKESGGLLGKIKDLFE